MKNTRFLALLLILALSLSFIVGCTDGTPPDTSAKDTTDAVTTAGNADETTGPVTDENGYEPLKYGDKRLTTTRVSVHDPSIVYEPNSGRYYLFGSHKAWATSKNLAGWSDFNMMSLETDNKNLFAPNIAWSKHGSTDYDIEGNMWAPDVIYNEAMGKWCMYMSINGDNFYSSIVLLTSDKINGDYEYVGTIVYSGFRNQTELAETDYEKVTGNTSIGRFVNGTFWNTDNGPNAIDPCVFYDADGDLWMSYGSWFGGIFLIRLDNNTGLRDLSVKYETSGRECDEYFGYRISGGFGGTGEGSYIVYDKAAGYYYLYVSYCGLSAASDNFNGYHIRLFRSKKVTGPYMDAAGNFAVLQSAGQSQTQIGVKLFGNYTFSTLSGNGDTSENGYKSGGHNSAFIDTDGQHYLVYHTRFNTGNEWHAVRVHQQFMNEDGWPVTAVYEHLGSVINKNGYSVDEIVGDYEFVDHGLSNDISLAGTGMLRTDKVTLNADGTITGDVTGTWEEVTGDDGNGYYVTMKIGSNKYKGVFFKQYDESSSHTERMTFTLIGNNDHSIWGSKIG